MDKLLQVSYYLMTHFPEGMQRETLAKLVYYCDGIYFQRTGTTITGEKYLHIDNCPLPVRFNETIQFHVEHSYFQVRPSFNPQGQMRGFFLYTNRNFALDLSKIECRKICKISKAFPDGKVENESLKYPNLYENYVLTPLYHEIKFSTELINTKIHFHKKKRLLKVSGNIFRVIFD